MQLQVEDDTQKAQHEDSVTLSPTPTLCADGDSMDVDASQDVSGGEDAWSDIDDSTPAVELWVPTAFFHRLKKLLSYFDPHDARYNIGDVPVNCTWGTGSRVSSLVHHGQTVNVWAIGHLRSVWIFATEADPRPSVRIALDLLRDIDVTGTKRLMEMATVLPRKCWLSTLDFCADRKDHDDQQVFGDIYDARATFAAKSKMLKLQPTELTVGDIVLVECAFVRNRVDRSDSAQWVAWTTTFQLHAVSVLLSRGSGRGIPSVVSVGARHESSFDGEL